MNKKIFGLITLILCILAGCVNSSIEGTGTIRGVVTDKSTNAPLQGVSVVLVSDDGSVNNTQTTISDGSYVFSQLFNGTYTLEFSKEEYESYKKTITIDGDGAKDGSVSLAKINVELTVTPSNLNFGDLERSKELYVSCASRSVNFSIKTEADWLTASPTEGIAHNSGTKITLVANRDLIDYGTQATILKINSSLGETEIPVSVTKVQESAPEVSTYSTIDSIIGERSIKISGTIISTGGSEIIRYGHCYSQEEMPTVEDSKSNLGKTKAIGDFSSVLNNLIPGQVYYVRAYAENNAGLVYSKEQARVQISQTTMPEVITIEAANIRQEQATLKGAIQSDGGADIIEYGFYYGTDENVENKVKVDLQSDFFEYTLKALSPDKTYYYKAYAINLKGEACGDILSFSTAPKSSAEGAPVVETLNVTDLNFERGILHANIVSQGTSDVALYGFYWGTNNNPTIRVIVGEEAKEGEYTYELKELEENTTYYYKAFAKNSGGYSYGTVQSFTTTGKPRFTEWVSVGYGSHTYSDLYAKFETYGAMVVEAGFLFGADGYKSGESTLHINSYDIIKKCEIIDNTISSRIDHPKVYNITYYCRPYFELENGEIYYGKVRYLYSSGEQSDL